MVRNDALLSVSDIAGATSDFATAIGIVLGLGAAWYAFSTYRRRFPRCSVEHQLAYRRTSSGGLVIRLSLKVKNEGLVLIQLTRGHVWIEDMTIRADQVIDFPNDAAMDMEISWPKLKHYDFRFEDHPCGVASDRRHGAIYFFGPRKIEPGERDELEFDFAIPSGSSSTIDAVTVYSFLKNTIGQRRRLDWRNSKEFGWNTTTLHNIGPNVEFWKAVLVQTSGSEREA